MMRWKFPSPPLSYKPQNSHVVVAHRPNWSRSCVGIGAEMRFSCVLGRNNNATSSSYVGKYCGDKFPPIITSSGRSLWMRFSTDCTIQYMGFKAVYQQIQNPLDHLPDIGKCAFDAAGFQVSIRKGLFYGKKSVLSPSQFSGLYRHCQHLPGPHQPQPQVRHPHRLRVDHHRGGGMADLPPVPRVPAGPAKRLPPKLHTGKQAPRRAGLG